MYFIRKKKDSHRDLAFTVNIEGRGMRIKKNKALSARDLNKPKNNIAVAYIPSGKEEKDSV